MAFDLNNFVIDRPYRATLFDKQTGVALWMIKQLLNPTLSMTADNNDVVDAIGALIKRYERNKQCTFSGASAIFDLGLMAAQSGTAKRVASAENPIVALASEELTGMTGTDLTLKHMPVGTSGSEIACIYSLDGAGNMDKKYMVSSTVDADHFTVNAAEKKISLPTSITTATRFLIMYNYSADGTEGNGAVEISANAVDFPTEGRLVVEVLGEDVCTSGIKLYAYLDFPKAKLASSFSINMGTESEHPFEITCMQDYCDAEKRLFTLIVPEA